MTLQPQTVQLLAVFAVLGSFALAELALGRFFPREAHREDNWLDVAVTGLFPLISGTVLAASGALCGWLMPEQRFLLCAHAGAVVVGRADQSGLWLGLRGLRHR